MTKKQSNQIVRNERSGWRDKDLSERHRLWGWDCPAQDLDGVFIEYDNKNPVALVEYKCLGAPVNQIQRDVLYNLAQKANVSAYLVQYKKNPWQFKVQQFYPRNRVGSDWITERKFVEMAYKKWRGRQVPKAILDKLDA